MGRRDALVRALTMALGGGRPKVPDDGASVGTVVTRYSGGAALSARTIARSMTAGRDTRSAQTALINAVIEKVVPALTNTRGALDRFHAMMRSKTSARLDPWIAMAARN
jgi:hypothetical protein